MMVALRPGLGNGRSSGVFGDVEIPGRVPRLASDRRFHHPGYELLRSITSEEVALTGLLAVEDATTLLESGLAGLARKKGRSPRTVRRHLGAVDVTSAVLVRRIRVRMTYASLAAGLPLSIVAKWLGFANSVTYRRFICRATGLSVRALRSRVRQSAVFHVPEA